MTGFGTTQVAVSSVKVQIDIKTVNHRYLDLSFHVPIGFASVEHKIKQLIQQKMQRGRITIGIRIVQSPGKEISLNRDVAKKYVQYARLLQRDMKESTELTVRDVIGLPGVIDVHDFLVTADDVWPLLERGIKRAVDDLVGMRRREGKSLAQDVRKQLKTIVSDVKRIRLRSERILAHKKKDLTSDEFKAFQRTIDVNEELARLGHHCAEMIRQLSLSTSVGKQIDFVAQEMQREVNTVGSKLQDMVATNAVIAMKSAIEKIREQAQNIE